jgi:hypothetical protein
MNREDLAQLQPAPPNAPVRRSRVRFRLTMMVVGGVVTAMVAAAVGLLGGQHATTSRRLMPRLRHPARR